MAEDHERYQVEDRAQDWKLATMDYFQSCACSMKLTSGDSLDYFTLQTQRKLGFSRGYVEGGCQILLAFTLWAVLAPRKAPASADVLPSRYQIWGVFLRSWKCRVCRQCASSKGSPKHIPLGQLGFQ